MEAKSVILVDREEAEKSDLVACLRVEDLPIPYVPAHQETCAECGTRIWVADLSPKGPKRACISCAEKIIEHMAERGDEIVFTSRLK